MSSSVIADWPTAAALPDGLLSARPNGGGFGLHSFPHSRQRLIIPPPYAERRFLAREQALRHFVRTVRKSYSVTLDTGSGPALPILPADGDPLREIALARSIHSSVGTNSLLPMRASMTRCSSQPGRDTSYGTIQPAEPLGLHTIDIACAP